MIKTKQYELVVGMPPEVTDSELKFVTILKVERENGVYYNSGANSPNESEFQKIVSSPTVLFLNPAEGIDAYPDHIKIIFKT